MIKRAFGVIFYVLAALVLLFFAYVGWYGYLMGFNPFIMAPPAFALAMLFGFLGFLLSGPREPR